MYKIFLSIFLTGFLIYSFSQNEKISHLSLLNHYNNAESLFSKAEKLAEIAGDDDILLEKADKVYYESLLAFEKIAAISKKENYDSLTFFALLRKGLISFYLNDPLKSKKDYLLAFSIKQTLLSIPDSNLFIPYVYTGGIYYSQNQFDSAFVYLKKAEKINDLYNQQLPESERLFNRLGVMYYETGNYKQARSYFEKAIAVLSGASETDKSLLVNYKINIASILVKLEEFETAKSIYLSLIPNTIFNNEIYHNLAIINLKENNYSNALEYLRKINYGESKKNIALYFNYEDLYNSLNKRDSASLYINRALNENSKWNGTRKNINHGQLLKLIGDQAIKNQNLKEGISYYQQAIIQFYSDFNDTDIYKNPEKFTGIFSYINLFNTLITKAEAFEILYKQEKILKQLEASLDAYRSAFKLANYVERTYNSDEARLFLNKIRFTTRSKPIQVCLSLFEISKNEKYLEDAYLFDQQNKASVLSLNVYENELRNANSNDTLFSRESSLKAAITRLALKAAQITDTAQLEAISSSTRDLEIQLDKVQEQIKSDPAFKEKQSTGTVLTLKELQQTLDSKTAVLSYHLSDKELLILLITGNKIDYFKTPIDSVFFNQVELLKASLHNTNGIDRYNGTITANYLYNVLIAPIDKKITNKDRLIIIPDNELNYLPFEALQDKKNKYLIQHFAIQYQFSTALLVNASKYTYAQGNLGFAPFFSKPFIDSIDGPFAALAASKDEVTASKGNVLIDNAADKNTFLRTANQYSTIHLATHASVNNKDHNRSYIAFYPGNNDFKLYAGEIYNLRLDSVNLIILSACETGSGKLIKGEGLMSLSRAFAYAGCTNIITSLWKAEDKTTAFIAKRLHHYLEKNYSKDVALQLAKLDLLKNNDIDPRYKSPVYWAHLIFIGNYEASHKSNNWWWIVTGIIVILLGYYLIKRKA